jgi:hypothetical protein
MVVRRCWQELFDDRLCSHERRSTPCLLDCLQKFCEIIIAPLDLLIDFGDDCMQPFPEAIQTGAEGRRKTIIMKLLQSRVQLPQYSALLVAGSINDLSGT